MQKDMSGGEHGIAVPPPRVLVSVIVVNYNGMRFLGPFFESLQHAFRRHDHEVIVVDNASTDGSLQWLRARDDIRLVALPGNSGFTGGNNVAVTHAHGDVLLLINNDTLIDEPLDALVEAALEPGVGAAGCRLRHGNGRLQYSVGLEHTVLRIVLSWLGFEKRAAAPALLRKFETDPRFYAQPHASVAWVSGACLATRRAVWNRLEGLDADFFMYCEDVDYCRRVRGAGLRVAYLPAPVVTHYEAGGKRWVGAGALLRTGRAYYLYTAKVHGRGMARLQSALLAGVFALRGVVFAAWGAAARGTDQRDLRRAKASGFRLAALQLSAAALRGRAPPLP
jgi:GT2 family glycosyltransferase